MKSRALITGAAACALVLGCGGSGDQGGAAARTPTATARRPTAEATSTPTATASARGAKLRKIGDFDSPVFVTAPRGDRKVQFVVEQGGRIMVVRNGRKLSTPFLDITGQVTSGGEQGLLSMAFSPDYASSGLFYVYFTGKDGDQHVVEYKRVERRPRATPARPGPCSTWRTRSPTTTAGCCCSAPAGTSTSAPATAAAPATSTAARGNAQNLGSLLGKILRIDPKASGGKAYSVPSGNPFVGRSGARGEIYAYGLRNPWRFSFDRRNGDLSIGDVGQNEVEEIDFVRNGRGKNFGWRPFEGRNRYTPGESAPGAVKPVIQRFHSKGNCSITGGVVVRDRSLRGVYGRYLFGDFCRGRIESARLSPGRARSVRNTSMKVESLSSFGEDARGRVYAVSLSGPVYRLVPR